MNPMRATLKAINQELAKRGIEATLANGGGYFLFRGPHVNSWLDRTVQVAKVSDLTLEQWLQAFKDLKKKNQEITGAGTSKTKRPMAPSAPSGSSPRSRGRSG